MATYEVVASGDTTTDTNNFQAAMSSLRSAGKGQIVIDGMLYIASNINLQGSALPHEWTMRGKYRSGCGFKMGVNGTAFGWLYADYNWPSPVLNHALWTRGAVDALDRANTLVLQASTPVKRGDILWIRSMDQIHPYIFPHQTGATDNNPTVPMFTRKVVDVQGTYTVYLDMPIPCAMTTANRWEYMVFSPNACKRWHWENLLFEPMTNAEPYPYTQGSIDGKARAFTISGPLYDSTFENIKVHDFSIGIAGHNTVVAGLEMDRRYAATNVDAKVTASFGGYTRVLDPTLAVYSHGIEHSGTSGFAKGPTGGYVDHSAFTTAYPGPYNNNDWYYFNQSTNSYWKYADTWVDTTENTFWPDRNGYQGAGGAGTTVIQGGKFSHLGGDHLLGNHPMSADFEVSGATIYAAGQNQVASESRGLRTTFRNCRFIQGSGGGIGHRVRGGIETLIENCSFEGNYDGILVWGDYTGGKPPRPMCHRLKIVGCRFAITDGPIVIRGPSGPSLPSDEVHIINNVFQHGNATGAYDNPNRALVTIGNGHGTGWIIRGNFMPKLSNLKSIDFGDMDDTQVDVSGNYFGGYTSEDMGFAGTNAAALAAKFGSSNKANII